jgi:hypothetical protein
MGPSDAVSSGTKRARFRIAWVLRSVLVVASLIYFSFCAYIYLTQDAQIYPRQAAGVDLPTDEAIREARGALLVPWDHLTPGAASPQGYVPMNFTKPAPRGTIVVFHGNGNWAGERSCYVRAFSWRGFRTFLYEYPGYGGRPGEPHESQIVPDAQALVRELDQMGYGPIYLWGESLGTGVAAAVASDPTLPIHGLVLVTPFNGMASMAIHFYPYLPVTFLLRDQYDSVHNLEHFAHPVCIVRSDEDELIPPAFTLLLYDSLPEPKKMIVQHGYGHNNWPDARDLAWWDDALDFIAPKAK